MINGGHRGIYTDRRQVNYDRARYASRRFDTIDWNGYDWDVKEEILIWMFHACRNCICDRACGWHGCWRDPRWCIGVGVIEDIYLLCVCEVAVAMVMIGESARWQGGSLLENFGHRGALELILQSLTYQSRGALHLNVLCWCPVHCMIEWPYLWSKSSEGSSYFL